MTTSSFSVLEKNDIQKDIKELEKEMDME